MNKKRGITIAAAVTLSMAMSTAAFAAPNDINGHWAQSTITKWTDNGYITGYPDGTFKPDNSITRAEFVVLVNKAMGYSKKGTAYFSDVSSSFWGYDEIMKGIAAGYVKGDSDGSFRPNDPVRRQEAAVMIAQILGLGTDSTGAERYTDYSSMPAWATGYIGAVSKAGLMAGYPDGGFKADRVMTRAETVVALNNVLNYDTNGTDNTNNNTNNNTSTKKEDYTLEKTSLKDMVITGDLIISSNLSSKSISLEDVTVEGSLIVKGGGTITADDCDINELVMNKTGATFKAEGKTKVKKTTFEKVGKIVGDGFTDVVVDNELSGTISIDAEIINFELDAETNIKLLSGTEIETFTATKNADRATVSFSSAEVDNMYIYDKIKITGKGDIDTMTVYVSGVTSSIKPDTVKTKNGADKPTYSNSSSSSSSSSKYDDLTVTKDDKTIKNGKYDDVIIKADDVTLNGTTIYGNLTIHEDVKNSSVTLKNVTVKGNVYIYGGGQNSIDFEDCVIEGNIYARKNYGNTPVGLDFDSDSASDFKGTLYIEKNGAVIKGSGTIKNVRVNTDEEVEIEKNITVTNLTVETKNTKLTVNGTVGTLTANKATTVSGSGTINKIAGSASTTIGPNITVKVTSVTLNKTALTLQVDGEETLTATVAPDNATDKTVTWTTSNGSVATVDNGAVTAVSAGTATITATADGKSATCTVTVNPKTVSVTGVTLDNTTATISVGAATQLTATLAPTDATNKNITWKTSDASVATVDENGTVTGVKAGTATITVTTEDGGKTATCAVTVNNVDVSSITLSQNTLNLIYDDENNKTATLTATVAPDNATDKTVTWTTSNGSVATVDNGAVTAVSAGTATITAKAGDKEAICTVDVTAKTVAVDSVSVTPTTLELTVGGSTGSLAATVSPENATDKTVTWTTSNESVATVNNGTVTAVSAGTAIITATTADGNKTATCTVTVKDYTISISGTNTVEAGGTIQLSASVDPTQTSVLTFTWTSSNTDIATVNNGTVTGVAAGTADITAKATINGKEVTGTYSITVTSTQISDGTSNETTP